MVWCGMVWCGVVWYGMVWYGMVCAWSHPQQRASLQASAAQYDMDAYGGNGRDEVVPAGLDCLVSGPRCVD